MCLRWGSRRSRRFVPVATVERVEDLAMSTFKLDPRGRFQASLWLFGAVILLSISTILYMVAFLTTGWGTVSITTLQGQDDSWIFGLWQCCRLSDDLCIGPRWPAYYSVARAFGVIGIFGHVLTLAWLIGFALEKLLDYDPCTLIALVSLDFFTSIVIAIQVSVFGTMWAYDMETMFADQTSSIQAELNYSFWITFSTAFLVVIAGILLIVELRTSIIRLEILHHQGGVLHKEEGSDIIYLTEKKRKSKTPPDEKEVPTSSV